MFPIPIKLRWIIYEKFLKVGGLVKNSLRSSENVNPAIFALKTDDFLFYIE